MDIRKDIHTFASMIKLKETRGRKTKYDYASMKKGGYIQVDCKSSSILTAAKRWAKNNKKPFEFAARKENGITYLYRIK